MHVTYQRRQYQSGAIEADILQDVLPKLDVIGFGENSVDRVVVVPQLPGTLNAPSKMRVKAVVRSCGGQVATAMAACASLGLRTAYAGVIGADTDGQLVRETLTLRGINLAYLHETPSAATRWATILVDATTGERSVLWNRDDALSMGANDVDAIDVTAARLVHVDDTDIAASVRLAQAARRAGVLVTTDIDASPQGLELVKVATHAILSEHALAVLSGEDDPEQGLRTLRHHSDGVLCVTLGPRGAMALFHDEIVTSPGRTVTAVDTTGAGDVFRAGFIVSLLAGGTLTENLRFANAAAAVSCTRMGAISGVPSLSDVTSAT